MSCSDLRVDHETNPACDATSHFETSASGTNFQIAFKEKKI